MLEVRLKVKEAPNGKFFYDFATSARRRAKSNKTPRLTRAVHPSRKAPTAGKNYGKSISADAPVVNRDVRYITLAWRPEPPERQPTPPDRQRAPCWNDTGRIRTVFSPPTATASLDFS